MNGWLLDTNVVSELGKTKCDAGVSTWVDMQDERSLHLSVVTIAEILVGAERARTEARRQEIANWLAQDIRLRFANRLLPIDEHVIVDWIETMDAGARRGRTFAQPDLLLAVTARLHDLCLVTRNSSHFADTGTTIFDPWRNALERPGQKAHKVNGVMTLDRLR